MSILLKSIKENKDKKEILVVLVNNLINILTEDYPVGFLEALTSPEEKPKAKPKEEKETE